MADGVFLGHADVAVQLDRVLRDEARLLAEEPDISVAAPRVTRLNGEGSGSSDLDPAWRSWRQG